MRSAARDARLRWSLHVLPEVCVGRSPAAPQNLAPGADRVACVLGLVRYLRGLARRGAAPDELRRLQAATPCGQYVEVLPGGDVRERPGARDAISLQPGSLSVALLDGRRRDRRAVVSLDVGEGVAAFSRAASALARGCTGREAVDLARDGGLDLEGVLPELEAQGLLVETPPPPPPRPPAPGPPAPAATGDRLSWLGHAALLFESGGTRLGVDLHLRPHVVWRREELAAVFSPDHAESRFFAAYGPDVRQLSPLELPPLDAVLVTHQDVDHFDLGVLMLLPETVPVVVPRTPPGRPWLVDLEATVRRVLGPRRTVIALGHGETVRFGPVRVTAFPFLGELPRRLDHTWSCYLLETDAAAVACTADSALLDETVDFLAERQRAHAVPLTLCVRPPHDGATTPGYRDEERALHGFTRLWGWYVQPCELFEPTEAAGISEDRLRRLAETTRLRYVLPYATGGAPWFRLTDAQDPLCSRVAGLSRGELDRIERRVAAVVPRVELFPLRHAEAVDVGAPLGPTGQPSRGAPLHSRDARSRTYGSALST